MRKEENTQEYATWVTQKVVALFGASTLAEVGRQSKWLCRRRKLTPTDWVSAIVLALGGCRVQWLADIWRSVQVVSGVGVQYKPFHKQLCRPGFAEFFRLLLERALHHFSGPVLKQQAERLRRFRDIVIHDGSSFALKDSLMRAWPGRFTTISPAAVELHVTMSLLDDNPGTIVLTADSESERAYRPTPLNLKDCLFLGDRGYQERQFFADMQATGGFFIVRGTKAIRPTISAVAGLAGRGRCLIGKRLAWGILPREQLDVDVDWELPNGELYRGRIVIFYRKDARNRDVFVYLHTNLSRADFPAESVSDLYRLRWQVELFFKECKSHANLHAFDTGKEEIAEGLIWASLLCAVLKRGLTHMAEAMAGVPLSTARAAGAAKHYLDSIMRALALGATILTARIADALEFLAIHATRAHPLRDRLRGRLASGLMHVAARAGGGVNVQHSS